jgi:hypothetical protein
VTLAPKSVAQATPQLVIDGTGNTATFTVNASNLADKITLTATSGLEVFPEELPAGAENSTVTVTLVSTLPTTTGKIILRSGDYRAYAEVTGYGTPLTEKNLSSSPVYNEGGIAKNFRVGDGFTAESGNYTVEFRAKIDEGSSQSVDAFAVTPGGASFKAYVEPKAIGIYNGENKVSLYNLQTTTTGGNSTFYNNDGKYHTYRFAVTSDKRIFAYRDGIQIATLRSQDYGNQASWGTENGDLSENLLKNPGFEGEVGYRATDSLFNQVEGWIVDPIDQYNCTYSCPTYEIDNTLDFNNHVMKLQRYNWNDGWGAGTVSQIVDVAPNTTYSLSFLAAGGMNTNSKGNTKHHPR